MNPNRPLHILLVDDEDIVHQTIGDYLRDLGHEIGHAREGNTAQQKAAETEYDLALVDVRMPGIDGLSLLKNFQETYPEMSVVIVTGHGNLEMAVQALRLGAADFLTKPVKLLELDAVLEKSSRIRSLRQGQRRLRETIRGIQAVEDLRMRNRALVGTSPATEEIRRQIRIAVEARCDTILLVGETGTGKEVVAREIHFLGKGDERPFIAVSCPAIPDTLFESELFGHVKGAFTGAGSDRPGYFELADSGTLFLDEIADLSPGAQAKLLRVLETRQLRRVGGAKEIGVDVQVIAATNADLESQVKSGKFRSDLFYRLNVFSIRLERLAKRPEDIIPLAEHFLSAFTVRSGLPVTGFSPGARDFLLRYPYPGNVRELRNLIEHASIICRSGPIQEHHLPRPDAVSAPAAPPPAPEDTEPERAAILQALEEAKWNRRQAAKTLGVPYSTLRYKLKKYGIE